MFCRTYRASNEKKDGHAPASNNLSHVHKLILEIQKQFKDEELERKQMEVRELISELKIELLKIFSGRR